MTQRKRYLNAMCAIGMTAILLFFFSGPCALAVESKDVAAAASLTPVVKIMREIVPWFDSLCVLSVGISIVQIMISRDQKTVSSALKFIYTVVAVFVIFNMSGAIIHFVDNAVPNHTYQYKPPSSSSTGSSFSSGLFNNSTTK